MSTTKPRRGRTPAAPTAANGPNASKAANASKATKSAPRFKTARPRPPRKAVVTQHEALRQLGALVLARRREVRFRLTERAAWQEATRLYAQFEAICALDDFPNDYASLPHAEQCAVRMQVAAACLEHAPQFARALKAARFVNRVGGVVHYRVPSESSALARHVTLNLENGGAFCTCPACGDTCYHIANARLMERLSAECGVSSAE